LFDGWDGPVTLGSLHRRGGPGREHRGVVGRRYGLDG
jgi:hypothetical protein